MLAAYRPTGKGRVERQVLIGREHVLAARSFDSIAELDAAFLDWLPIRRAQVHRTHGEVIAVRAERDRAALLALPEQPYLVTERHLRRVGRDCLISFEASLYSVPARKILAGQRVELRVDADLVAIHALLTDTGVGEVLAVHPRATTRGSWVVDPAHWAGLPDGHTRATVVETTTAGELTPAPSVGEPNPLAALLNANAHAAVPVARRPLTEYQAIATDQAIDAAAAATNLGRS